MAEISASPPSASLDDEGPVMDEHGSVKDTDGEVCKGHEPEQNGLPSTQCQKHGDNMDKKSVQVPTIPNGFINHSSQNTDSDGTGMKGDPSIYDTKVANSESADAGATASLPPNQPDVNTDQSISIPDAACDAVSDTLSKVTITDEAVEDDASMGGDGIKLDCKNGIEYVVYESELQMPDIMRLITKDLSEPYSIYTYRYFIHNWPKLCFLAMDGKDCVGAIVCKLDLHKKMVRRGYIAMLAVDQSARRKGIGSHLVMKAIRAMVADDCDEVVLETEITNKAALHLYENLGFVRDKRLFRYYLNGVDALRLKLWLR